MAKLTNVRRIIKEDFPTEVQKWLDKLLIPLNNAIEQFTFAMNKNLTITDNFDGALSTLENVETSLFPLSFKNPLPRGKVPQLVIIAQISEDSASPVIFTTAPFVQWDSDGQLVTIRTITGLDPTRVYNVRLWVQAS